MKIICPPEKLWEETSQRVEDRSMGPGLRPRLYEKMARTGSVVQRSLGSFVRAKRGTLSFAYGGA